MFSALSIDRIALVVVLIALAEGPVAKPVAQQVGDARSPASSFPSPVSGTVATVPHSLYPSLTATIGPDGKVTIDERQGPAEPQGAAAPSAPGGPTLRSVPPTIGPDGKVTIDERQGPAEAQGAAAPSAPGGLTLRSVPPTIGPDGDQTRGLPSPTQTSVTIHNLDSAGEGFNDVTPVAPVFGNRATTLGQQRLSVLQAAADYWGAILKSRVAIEIDAKMDPLSCTATSAVLGSAGPITAHRDYTGAPLANTWYVQAVANSRAGADLAPTYSDILAIFSSRIDSPTCLGSTSWWYGIGAPAPAGTLDFYSVALHELAHGLGVLSLVNLTSGQKFGSRNDAYESWLWDQTLGGWPSLSNEQRLASSVNSGQVVFKGPRATAAAKGFVTSGLNAGYPQVYAPSTKVKGASISHFDTALSPNELLEPVVAAPPGPYAFLTSGVFEDVGWTLLTNGVFDYGSLGTWTWNRAVGWSEPTAANPLSLEPWNGNFVGGYPDGTWLWNSTTRERSQLTSALPNQMKACGNDLLWSSTAYGTWRWNTSAGWLQPTSAAADSLQCFGGEMAWESSLGTWLWSETTGWREITTANASGMLTCGARLVWWWPGETWYWDDATGWHLLTSASPDSVQCYRGQLAWESALGTWIYSFTSGWQQITTANPDQILAWGPTLVWESSLGTWTYDTTAGWTQITTANPTNMEVLGVDLLWSSPSSGTWVWNRGAGWTSLSSAASTQIVGTGAVK
jgi:hypothetical protein